jgi:hypothetical protein
MTGLHDSDFYAWTQEEASLLRAGKLNVVDMEHIAEEIESMGRNELLQLEDRLIVLQLYLLKWQFQPNFRGNSWQLSIKEQRVKIARHLRKNPSLKALLDETITDAYGDALIGAEREAGLPEQTFPAVCPWTFAQMMDDGFWPD